MSEQEFTIPVVIEVDAKVFAETEQEAWEFFRGCLGGESFQLGSFNHVFDVDVRRVGRSGE